MIFFGEKSPELGTLEWDILNPKRLLIWRLITRAEQALYKLEIKKKRRSSINPDIHHSKVPSSANLKIVFIH